ncbi:MAG: HsdR family type I site-specific deoxyribonuclease [Paludibacteraceae bacterium]
MFNNEKDFEIALCEMLSQKGWEHEVIMHPTEQDLLKNWANILFQNNNQIDRLNDCPLTDGEMQQLLEQIQELRTPQRLNSFINGKTVSVRRDNPDDSLHLGKEITLKIFDPHEIAAGQSRYQIVRQPHFAAPSHIFPQRRGDLMLLINGMPVIHIELKKSGIPISQASNQIEKYSREGIFRGLFRLIQIFVAMTPEETIYFANPGEDGRFNKDFYFHWADFNNQPMNDWKEIATHLLSIPMAHQLIGYYTIADRTDGILKVLRSYQYNAVRCICDKVAMHRDWLDKEHQLGGYIWHTTGSGKTMSSFKAAQLIADSNNADKVVFVIDRIELGTQSAREYRNFSEIDDDIQETEDTQELIRKLKSPAVKDKLIVSSIQKLGIIADGGEKIRPVDIDKINGKRIVFIVDECHRSTFGDSFQAIKCTFPTALFFGFTGTPIINANNAHNSTTDDIFGDELHRYSIADGIRDKNVLGFDPYKVLVYRDRDVRETIARDQLGVDDIQEVYDDKSEQGDARRELLNHFLNIMPMAGKVEDDGSYTNGIEDYIPALQYQTHEYCEEVVKDIVDTIRQKSQGGKFHAIFTTTSIPQAIVYYRLFKQIAPNLNVTALFDPSLENDNPNKVIYKEDGLAEILEDYNNLFHQHFTIPTHAKFKKDLSNRLAHKQPYINLKHDQRLDLLIVVSQMLTGFDSKWVNTLYVDKVMESADLIQAFSRTNRLYGYEKPFGTIKYYQRPHTMERNIKAAIDEYSGNRAFGLFVYKLDMNINGMNQKFEEIRLLFEKEGILNFQRLPEPVAIKGKFAKLFRQYNQYLEAAKVQGFYWKKRDYLTPEGIEISVSHTEHQYNTLVQRYKELFEGRGGGGFGGYEELPYEIDTHLTEIDTGKIDNDYMNLNFERYLRALEQPNVSQEELSALLNDLSASFATLPQEQQEFAEIFMHDVQSGNITLESGKTCRDYITDYMTTVKEQRINHLAEAFGLNRELLQVMMTMRITEQNVDEFGRFSQLQNSIDTEKAQAYFLAKTGKEIDIFDVYVEAGNLLRKFILRNGFDI